VVKTLIPRVATMKGEHGEMGMLMNGDYGMERETGFPNSRCLRVSPLVVVLGSKGTVVLQANAIVPGESKQSLLEVEGYESQLVIKQNYMKHHQQRGRTVDIGVGEDIQRRQKCIRYGPNRRESRRRGGYGFMNHARLLL
jgi:hypothetical protein